MNTTDTSTSRLASERRSQRPPVLARGLAIRNRPPPPSSAQAPGAQIVVAAVHVAAYGIVAAAVAEARIVVDQVELAIDHAELLPDALDEGANIGAVAGGTVAGDEALAVDQIVDLPVRDILARTGRHQADDVELGQGQVDAEIGRA